MSWFSNLMNRVRVKEDTSIRSLPVKVEATVAIVKKESIPIKIDFINSEHLFYDLLFGQQANSTGIENSLELKVVEKVTELLLKPNNVIFEPFPKLLKDALDLIDKQASVLEIEACLQQDPKMASEIVKLANSPVFKCAKQEVKSLKMAINFVGIESLKQIVTTASLSSVMKVSPIYFKVFGEKIWQHSLNTANVSQQLAVAYGQDADVAFFVGLIHDVGKIAIFNTLVNEIKLSIPGTQPGSLSFREMMTTISTKLSVTIVKGWDLPEEIVKTLKQYSYVDMIDEPDILTKILVEAKLISEVSLLLKSQLISELDAEVILSQQDIDYKKLSLVEY